MLGVEHPAPGQRTLPTFHQPGIKPPGRASRAEGGIGDDSFEPTGSALIVCASTPLDLCQFLKEINCTVYEAHSCREALFFLCRARVSVILCDSSLRDGNWKDILAYIAPLPSAPRLIVSCCLADDSLGSEVLNLGGYDVLAQPFARDEVIFVVSSALRQWSDEYSRPALARRAAC